MTVPLIWWTWGILKSRPDSYEPSALPLSYRSVSEMEHGTGVEPVYAVLQTAAWAAWLIVRKNGSGSWTRTNISRIKVWLPTVSNDP